MDLVVTPPTRRTPFCRHSGALIKLIAILNSHGGGPNFPGPDKQRRWSSQPKGVQIIAAMQKGTGTPQAIVFAGCSTAEAAHRAATALNTTAFGTTASSYSPENAVAAAVLADV